MIRRVNNFSAGPSTLPLDVLEEAQAEFVDYHGAGMALIEMSHRGKHFDAVHHEAMAMSRKVFQVPDDFQVLFLQGGATLQFSMVPMNLLQQRTRAGYVDSGSWAQGAISDARHYGEIYTAWDGQGCDYTRMPATEELQLQPDTCYLHITSNETIGGIRYVDWPAADVPLICDMSSDYMSRSIPWDRFDLVYGGLQKNLGPAGMALLFVRDSILEHCNRNIGRYLRYDIHAEKDSMFNTPPVFPIYMLGKILKWMDARGGLETIEAEAEAKAAILYSVIDSSDGYFHCPVDKGSRSVMNVVFRLTSEELEKRFLDESESAELLNLKGHRSVGGCRASIYNAMPREGAQALADFMIDFRERHPV
ncbi:MAG TPA: 3-phosphoserine/phosphohydroxythreonine transaminase [Arenicellales bacterium]|jgi:phosphoserine aminotransferase|nr:3-phosphoserine/phosphohydroxythreonine aminotransferase [Acidiferrobacteraceae bacterium]MDP6138172.1 3-phosphoserine/phosphohydroxythreonine transaminase [Arenicellales bacterium]MDP7219333.1 3-phosphoserine/phosphohydroxythreonine transaminase [Arenicellales bacterium]HCF72445.1 3-phosphoserine/phosphohydroxythreonine transaminase [Gammaproteobacteria bacterium]HJP10495.1 3-phosphoserine/phosphohydroxythreonine transaminase [Arenicellales bacterium]|tara:strand:+ start:26922 stop:28010 length:1089 start_codon:yes stop_codon:yes gene_type:complete